MNIFNVCIYLIGMFISFLVFAITNTPLDYIGLLSQGAILATFGSGLITVADILERDKLERVKQNHKIFYDINKVEPWIRWPFIPRKQSEKLLNNHSLITVLENPEKEFDVGTHTIFIKLPTVLEDLFDLPIFRQLVKMSRYQKAFKTKYDRDKNDISLSVTKKEEVHISYLSFLCMYDSIKSACSFRLARLLKHLSIAIILGSVLMVILCINNSWIVGCLNKAFVK
ncbi:hypothetical protein [Clostridium tagluense]|uniref:Uncharacterized protein n=1 Tax=Clostridium tagluense TaxID=360422 RepID=A0A401UTX3_9CLOT|nr:hypothetical protein [Clostridium tagluense]GCD12987.1 hypothetical protein Ctaglu_46100 [Clostridium tagluense]